MQTYIDRAKVAADRISAACGLALADGMVIFEELVSELERTASAVEHTVVASDIPLLRQRAAALLAGITTMHAAMAVSSEPAAEHPAELPAAEHPAVAVDHAA